jgi:hypothetical protein
MSLIGDFGYILDFASSVKHAELNRSVRPSTQMVGFANTEVTNAGYGVDAQPEAPAIDQGIGYEFLAPALVRFLRETASSGSPG